jgi:rod shape-determining protein MreD
MTRAYPTGGWVIVVSFLLAFWLSEIPLPGGLDRFRPDWVAMVLIYWGMALPHRIGIGVGWGVGLLLDVGRGGLLGQHALALAVVAYLTAANLSTHPGSASLAADLERPGPAGH